MRDLHESSATEEITTLVEDGCEQDAQEYLTSAASMCAKAEAKLMACESTDEGFALNTRMAASDFALIGALYLECAITARYGDNPQDVLNALAIVKALSDRGVDSWVNLAEAVGLEVIREET